MSLQVWLPLTGDLHNQGLADVSITNTSAVVNNSGKIGKCYSFGTAKSYFKFDNVDFMHNFSECSISLWINILTWNTSYATYFQFGLGSTPWAHYIFSLLRNNAASTLCFTISNGSSATNANCLTPEITLNTWYHLTFTYANGHCKIYVNGENTKDYTTTIVPNFAGITTGIIGACNNGSNYQTNCLMNDFRIYNHALSDKEVEEISKGLVLHYKLDQNANVLNNCYNYPTFNTSSTNGGWSHWGSSGHQGSYGQNTDKQYIFDKTKTYSHWWADGAKATKSYLLYQSPAFEGGIRSLQAILKEENSLPITENIVFPAWNARNGGAASNIWTSIEQLGDGFYLCKCEGISQSGSDDLIGFYVRAGYKVYISEAYCENDKTFCSDIFNQNNLTTIYDSSGYNNNGIANQLTTTSISAKYKNGIVFNGSSSYVKTIENKWMAQHAREMTINLWAKAATWPTSGRIFSCTETGGFNTEAGSSGYWRFPIYVCTNEAQTSYAYKYDSQEIQISALPINEWVMLTFVYDSTGTRTYINGELHHTYTNTSYGIRFNTNARLFLGCEANGANPSSPYFNGQESDFRIYYTALTNEQILELYNTSATIDNKGNVYSREYIENNKLNITKTGLFQCNKIYDDDELTVASIVKSTQQVQGNTIYEY